MLFTKGEIKEFKVLLNNLFNFMVKEGYTCLPRPDFILDCKVQKEKSCIFVKTGYFDPNADAIRIFMCDNKGKRAFKDILRTCAHELIHWKQQVNGEISNNGYKTDKVSEDIELLKLEVPAYAIGNIAFRNWTETWNGSKKKI